MKKSNMKKSDMGMNILLFFVLVGSCLGIAAFIMSLTKKSGEGYSNLKHNNTEPNDCLGNMAACDFNPDRCCPGWSCNSDPVRGPPNLCMKDL